MATQAIDIDALARRAQHALTAEPEPAKADLLTIDIGIEPANWNILVEPREISDTFTDSVIAKPEISKKVEGIVTTIARVIKVGPTALTGKTNGGIEVGLVTDRIKTREELIGSNVVYQRYTGHELRNRRLNFTLVSLTVTELLAVVDHPDDWECRY